MVEILEIIYAPAFVRRYILLSSDLKEEIEEKIELFKNRANHKQLKVHKLKGRLAGRHSFSVNYSYRIIFRFTGKNTAELITIGDHDVYK